MTRTRLIVSAAVVLAAGQAAAHGPFDGFWAIEPDWCGNEAGTTDQVPLMIDLPIVRGHESQCVIDSFQRIGGGDAWRTELSCTGEGETWTRRSMFGLDRAADGRPRRLVEIDLDEGTVSVFTRCD